MTHPVRLRLSRARGFDLQAHSRAVNGLAAVNVARPTKWGNPFVVGKHGTRADCVRWFIVMCDGMLVVNHMSLDEQMDFYRNLRAEAETLRGRNLACYCRLPSHGEPDLCHAAVLLAWVNNSTTKARSLALEPILFEVFARDAVRPTCEAVDEQRSVAAREGCGND